VGLHTQLNVQPHALGAGFSAGGSTSLSSLGVYVFNGQQAESWYTTGLAPVMQSSDQQQLGAADRIYSGLYGRTETMRSGIIAKGTESCWSECV
jgi:hypothetical protein